MELGNLISDGKGKGSRATTRGRNTDALIRLRPLHSSDEGPVIGLERRGQTIGVALGQPKGRSLTMQWKAGYLPRWYEP